MSNAPGKAVKGLMLADKQNWHDILCFQKFLSSSFSEKNQIFGITLALTQPTKILLSRYTAGFISDNTCNLR